MVEWFAENAFQEIGQHPRIRWIKWVPGIIESPIDKNENIPAIYAERMLKKKWCQVKIKEKTKLAMVFVIYLMSALYRSLAWR